MGKGGSRGDDDPFHARCNSLERVFQLRNHASTDDAFRLVCLEIMARQAGNHAVVVGLVAENAFLLKAIIQGHVPSAGQSLGGCARNGVSIGVEPSARAAAFFRPICG